MSNLSDNRRLPTIGGRIWKTGLAVALSLAICRAFRIPEPVFAGVAAVICMQPTVLQTFRRGLERLQATVIGAGVALGILALVMLYPLPYVRSAAAGVAVVIVLWMCLLLRWLDAMVLAAATVVVVMIQSEERGSITIYALQRTLVTAIGIVVATLVNAFMFLPRIEDRYPRRLPRIAETAFDEFEEAVRLFCTRDLDGTKAALERCTSHDRDFERAALELSWFEDSAAVRQMLPFQRDRVAPALAEIHSIVESAHQSASKMLQDTIAILQERPDYVLEDAAVYHIIGEALESASKLKQAIAQTLRTGDRSILDNARYQWTDDLHSQFIKAMRAAHRSPRDIFPLFEVASVGVELRNHTRRLARLRSLLAENEEIASILHLGGPAG